MVLLGMMFVVVHPPLPLVIGLELAMMVLLGLRELGALESLSAGIPRVFA